jgi:hypothetical protein
MKHYKNFKQYSDVNHPYMKLSSELLLLISEDGEDWYLSQSTFDSDTVKVVYDELGIVIDYNTDVTRLVPFNCSVIEFDPNDVPKENFISSYVVEDGELKKRKLSPEKLKSNFEVEKQKRLANARDVLQTIELIRKNSVSVQIDENLVVEWEAYFVSIMTSKYSKSFVFGKEPQNPF